MVMLTVIGKKQAKEGMEFTFMGSISNCKDCKVRNICFHLEKGNKYRVVGLRNVLHECPMHEDGVMVVQVEEVLRNAVLPKKIALEGSTISYETPKCSHRGCEHYAACFLYGLEPGQKKKVAKVMDKVVCIIGQNRVKVMLK
jgi:uncharacterized protein (UPF0179 family)